MLFRSPRLASRGSFNASSISFLVKTSSAANLQDQGRGSNNPFSAITNYDEPNASFGDFDNDGDLDLFIGARTIPWQYGVRASSYLLENDGNGNFRDVTHQKAPQLLDYGFVKDAKWEKLC